MTAAAASDAPPHPRLARRRVGHDAAWAEVRDAWETGRFPHAWLIAGPRGIGKATFSYLLAKAILGHAPASEPAGLFGAEPAPGLCLDPASPAAAMIESQSHPDLLVAEPGWSDDKQTRRRTEIVVEDIRAVGAFLAMTPAMGGWRVVIVDAADEMNRNAANALLKVLEEPPERAVLFLVAHNPGRLLPTVRSRCRMLKLSPLDDAAMDRVLADLLPPGAITSGLKALARGSVGEALALAAGGGDRILAGIGEILAGWPGIEASALLKFADFAGADEARFRIFAAVLGLWFSDLMRQGAGAPARTPGDPAIRQRMLDAVPLEQWGEVWEKVMHLFQRTDAIYLDRRQVVLAAFRALSRPAF